MSQFPADRATVLVIEDDEMLRPVLTRTLDRAGFRVFSADNGATAFPIVRGLGSAIALVLTDIGMPVMDGLKLPGPIPLSTPPRRFYS
jgi:DNA-binding response OmpR family regulator